MYHDIVIVGASFAGLACARELANHGLSVLVLERKSQPDDHIHTTGILVKEAQEEWPAPRSLVREIKRVRLYGPSLRSASIENDDYFFLATDTGRLIAWLQDEVQEQGVNVRLGTSFKGVEKRNDRWFLDYIDSSCSYLVGADGARSEVAKYLGLGRNTKYLKGVEYAIEPTIDEELSLHCFVDPRFAKGYIGWVLPGVGMTQVGLAYHPTHAVDLSKFVNHIEPLFGLARQRILEKRGGIIPIGGLLDDFYTDGAMLIGDAAGMVSPLTAGGIHRAYRYGRLSGALIASYLLDNGQNPGSVIREIYPPRRWQHTARWVFDRLPMGVLTEAVLRTPPAFRRIVEKIFFDRMNWPD